MAVIKLHFDTYVDSRNIRLKHWKQLQGKFQESAFQTRQSSTQVVRVWVDQVGGGGVDPPCIKIGYSEPTQFGKSQEPRRVLHPSRERLGFFSALWYSILIGWRGFRVFGARFWLAADKNLVLG